MSKPTPGPWQAYNAGDDDTSDFRIHRPGMIYEGRIARVGGQGRNEDEANARLVAAAPDLLSALKGATVVLRTAWERNRDIRAGEMLDRALAAIAKAEGAHE